MPHHRQPARGSFVSHHLATADPDSAAEFYGRLFGWTVRDLRVAGSLGALCFRSGDVEVATAGAMGQADGACRWLPCLETMNPDAVAAAAERLGALLERPTTGALEAPVIVVDPVGARFVITAAEPGSGPAVEAAAPGRFCWSELNTAEPGGAAAFYEALAGWASVERHHGQEGRYWVFRHGGREIAGMLQGPDVVIPSCWVPYVQVVSSEETAALAEQLGGSLVTPPGDVPGRGRYAVLRDPGGALVAVFALTDAA